MLGPGSGRITVKDIDLGEKLCTIQSLAESTAATSPGVVLSELETFPLQVTRIHELEKELEELKGENGLFAGKLFEYTKYTSRNLTQARGKAEEMPSTCKS